MDYQINKEAEMLRKSAREFFLKECPKEKIRELKDEPKAYDKKIWNKLVKLGFLGLIIPEEFGGMDGNMIELALFMEELGRNIVPMPYHPTVTLCAQPIIKFGTDDQKERYLPGIAEKGDIWTLAQTEKEANNEASEIQLTATKEGDGYILNGTKVFIPYAHVAKMMLVAARTSVHEDPNKGISFFIVDPKSKGIKIEIIPTVARDARCEVVFENVFVAKSEILGNLDAGWEILDSILQDAALMKAAEMSGGAQAAFEMGRSYVSERKQFDKTLGSFQGLQFRMVDLLIRLEGLKFLVYNGAWRLSEGLPARAAISAAKVRANEVYHDVCYNSMSLHGASGWTEEMDIGLFHLRTRSLIYDGGATELHLENIAKELENEIPDFVKLRA